MEASIIVKMVAGFYSFMGGLFGEVSLRVWMGKKTDNILWWRFGVGRKGWEMAGARLDDFLKTSQLK